MSVIADAHSLDIVSYSADQTGRLGARLGALLQPGDVVALQGELGAGKTCLVQGIARGLGIDGPVSSPSFTLVNEYPLPGSRARLYHVDLYRLDNPARDALAIGLEEYMYGEGITVIEWADRAPEIMPTECLTIEMRHIDEYRRGLLLRAAGRRPRELLEEFRKVAFGR